MMGRTALKITLAVAMAAGLLLGVSGCGNAEDGGDGRRVEKGACHQ